MLSTFSWSLQAATRTFAHAQSPPSTLGMYTVVLKPCVFQGTRWMLMEDATTITPALPCWWYSWFQVGR